MNKYNNSSTYCYCAIFDKGEMSKNGAKRHAIVSQSGMMRFFTLARGCLTEGVCDGRRHARSVQRCVTHDALSHTRTPVLKGHCCL